MPTPLALVHDTDRAAGHEARSDTGHPGGRDAGRERARERPPVTLTGSFALAAQLDDLPVTLVVRPWADRVIDAVGFDTRSVYAEMFWLPTVGPTALWLVRRLVGGLEHYPDGYELDLEETARALGLGFSTGRAGPFLKALDRCALFGLIRPGLDGVEVRRRLAPLPRRYASKMPPHLRAAHDTWLPGPDEPEAAAVERATALARALLHAGDEPEAAEHHLLALGIDPRAAALGLGAATRVPEPTDPPAARDAPEG